MIETAMIIGAIVSALTYTISAVINNTPITLSGFIQSTVMGAVSAMVTFGIGEYFTLVKSFIPKMTYQALAHGTFQGAMTGLQGGKFWNGFAAGSLSSVASSLWQGGDTPNGQNCHWNGLGGKFAQDTGGIIAFGTIAGGAGAALTGGNFWQGAVTGFFVSGLNHAMHSDDNGYDENGNKVSDKGGNTTDYMYDEKGNEISSTKVIHRGVSQGEFRELGGLRGYGVDGYKLSTGAITDDSLNFTANIVGAGEIYQGGKLLVMGLSKVLKSAVGVRTVLGSSKYTLKSSVHFEKMVGSKSINIFGIKSLPTLYGKSSTWGTFLGRNAPIIGMGRIGFGGYLISQ